MVVEATGTATGGNNPHSTRIHKAMDDAYLKAVVDGVNNPDEILERKLAARAAMKDRIRRENAADELEQRVKRMKTNLEEMRNLVSPGATAALLVHLNEIEAALTKTVDEAFRNL